MDLLYVGLENILFAGMNVCEHFSSWKLLQSGEGNGFIKLTPKKRKKKKRKKKKRGINALLRKHWVN